MIELRDYLMLFTEEDEAERLAKSHYEKFDRLRDRTIFYGMLGAAGLGLWILGFWLGAAAAGICFGICVGNIIKTNDAIRDETINESEEDPSFPN